MEYNSRRANALSQTYTNTHTVNLSVSTDCLPTLWNRCRFCLLHCKQTRANWRLKAERKKERRNEQEKSLSPLDTCIKANVQQWNQICAGKWLWYPEFLEAIDKKPFTFVWLLFVRSSPSPSPSSSPFVLISKSSLKSLRKAWERLNGGNSTAYTHSQHTYTLIQWEWEAVNFARDVYIYLKSNELLWSQFAEKCWFKWKMWRIFAPPPIQLHETKFIIPLA